MSFISPIHVFIQNARLRYFSRGSNNVVKGLLSVLRQPGSFAASGEINVCPASNRFSSFQAFWPCLNRTIFTIASFSESRLQSVKQVTCKAYAGETGPAALTSALTPPS